MNAVAEEFTTKHTKDTKKEQQAMPHTSRPKC